MLARLRGVRASRAGLGATLALAGLAALPAVGLRTALAGDKPDAKEDDEAFARHVVELIQRSIEAEASNALDQTPLETLEGGDREAGVEIYRRLDAQRMTLNFDDNTFDDVMDFFRDGTGINIVVSRRAQELLAGSSAKVKLRLKDVKVRNALELVLTQTDATLRYGVRNGVLEVGTQEDWKGRGMFLEIYPLDEILYRAPDFPAPEAGIDMLTKQKWGRGGRP